jgi:homoserine kinase
LLRLPDEADGKEILFDAAAAIEGHPDNAAPAVYGGLTVIADGRVRRFDVPEAIRPVVLVPEHARLATEDARRALPERVPLVDAVANIAHGALVVHAITTGDVDLLRMALRDRLHEDVRLALVPEVREIFLQMRSAGAPVCVSGAGPSLIAFETDRRPAPDPGEGWRVLRPGIHRAGAEVRTE